LQNPRFPYRADKSLEKFDICPKIFLTNLSSHQRQAAPGSFLGKFRTRIYPQMPARTSFK
jgi:hypothetical protein